MIKYLNPVEARSADELTAQVYAQIKRDFGALVEPFVLHSPSPKLLAAVWSAARETEVTGKAPRAFKEAVAATVSRLNRCPYCVDAHTIMLDAASERHAARAVTEEHDAHIADAALRAVVDWAKATRTPRAGILRAPPFSRSHAPEFIGTAVFYHYINRMASVLLSETPLPSNRAWLKGPLKQIAGRFFSLAVNRSKQAGESLAFLPAAALPADMAWAVESPTVAGAFARLAWAVEEEGKNALADEVREMVHRHVQEWNGEIPDFGKTGGMVAALTGNAQVAARLTLTTALSPSQVTPGMVYAYLAAWPEQEKLLGALSWASFTTARRIGTWLNMPAA